MTRATVQPSAIYFRRQLLSIAKTSHENLANYHAQLPGHVKNPDEYILRSFLRSVYFYSSFLHFLLGFSAFLNYPYLLDVHRSRYENLLYWNYMAWSGGHCCLFHTKKNLKHTLKRNEILIYGTTWMNPENTLDKINTKGQILYDSTWYDMTPRKGKFTDTDVD